MTSRSGLLSKCSKDRICGQTVDLRLCDAFIASPRRLWRCRYRKIRVRNKKAPAEKPRRLFCTSFPIKEGMARVTRLELAASGVTGRRSNQLSYTRMVRGAVFSSRSKVVQALFCQDFSIFSRVLPAVETDPASGTLKFTCQALVRRAGEGDVWDCKAHISTT